MPTTDLASTAPWLESQRRSRARRFAAVRALRRTCLAQSASCLADARHRSARRFARGIRAGVGVALASLTIATGGAMAAGHHHHRASGGAAAVRAAGSTVTALQRALGIPADGIYGPQTRRAVRHFQRRHGLTVDGIAGPQTLAALGIHARSSSTRSTSGGARGVLAQIAQCESGGDPSAVSADGHYRGKYQFTRRTWRDMGGTGDPARASEATQDRMALRLYRARGLSPWPTCSRGLG